MPDKPKRPLAAASAPSSSTSQPRAVKKTRPAPAAAAAAAVKSPVQRPASKRKPAAAAAAAAQRASPAPRSADTIMGMFGQLADLSEGVRQAAADRLAELVRAEPGQLQDQEYALKRLTRGLSSNRPTARQGFALGLCVLLRETPSVLPGHALDLVEESTAPSARGKGDEERDKLMGRGFGYLALIQSGRLAEQDGGAAEERVVKGLVGLAAGKTWMREFVSGALSHLVEGLERKPSKSVLKALEPFVVLDDALRTAAASLDPEQLAVVAALQVRFAEEKVWLVRRGQLQTLITPLATAWRADPPRLVLCWEKLVAAAIKAELVGEFWDEVVEPALLRGGIVSPQRKCAAMLVFGCAAKRLAEAGRPDLIASCMLTQDFVQALLQHASSKQQTLHEPARRALEDLQAALDASRLGDAFQTGRLEAVQRLRWTGEDRLDCKARKTTVNKLLQGMQGVVLDEYVDSLKQQFEEQWAVDALLDCARVHPALLASVMEFFFVSGFFGSGKSAMCRAKFLQLLGSLGQDALGMLRQIHGWWKLQDANGLEDEAQSAALAKALKTIKRLKKAEGEDVAEARALELLISFVALLLLVGEDESELQVDVVELLEDLEIAAGKLREGAAEGVDPVAVVVDALLALLAQPSSLVRDVVAKAAKALAGRMAESAGAVEILCEALSRPLARDEASSVKSRQENGDGEEDEEGAEQEEEEEDEEAEQEEEEVEDQATKGGPEPDAESEDEYDRAIGEYFKHRQAASGKGVKRAKKKALRDAIVFKLRVLDLVEAIVLKSASGQCTPLLAPALLTVVEQSAAKTSENIAKELMQRVKGVARKLFRAQAVPKHADPELCAGISRRAVQLMRSTADRQVAALALDAVGYGLNLCGARGEDGGPAVAVLLRPVVADMLEGRGVKAEAKALGELFERHPAVAVTCLEVVCGAAPRTPFQRSELLGLLHKLQKVCRPLSGENLALLAGACEAAIVREDEDLANSKSNPGRLRDALKLALALKPEPGFVLSDELQAVLKRLVKGSNSPVCKQLAAQLLQGA